MDLLTGAGLAAPAGLNAYIPLLTVGLLNRFTDLVTLESPYDIISSDAGLIVLTILLLIELFADAIPGVDSINDVIQTLIRPAAGAVLVLSSDTGAADLHPVLEILTGAGLAGVVHAIKALGRPFVTLATAGIGNPGLSTIENIFALVASIMAILIPILAAVMIVILLVIAIRWVVRRRRFDATSQQS